MRSRVRCGCGPRATLEGLAAGLHVIVRLARPVDVGRLEAAAQARSVGVYPLAGPRDAIAEALVLGYAAVSEPALHAGVPLLAACVSEATIGR